MREYIKNKDFIPYAVYNKRNIANNKKELRLIIIFILIGSLLFSLNIKQKSSIKEKQNKLLQEQYESDMKSINYSNIIGNCDILLNNMILECEATNKDGYVKIKDFSDVNKFSKNKKIDISNIEYNEKENYYKVSFNAYDK